MAKFLLEKVQGHEKGDLIQGLAQLGDTQFWGLKIPFHHLQNVWSWEFYSMFPPQFPQHKDDKK